MGDIRKIMHRTAFVMEAASGVRPALDIQGALAELKSKDHEMIEYETGLRWAARAVASYQLALQSNDKTAQTLRFTQGDDYKHEALEHASQVNDGGKLLAFVSKQMEEARAAAFAVVVKPAWNS